MNKKLFKSSKNVLSIKPANTVNEAGGQAYSLSDKAALAQYVCTGCINSTYYASDEDQLKKILELSKKVDVQFLAKLAVYARQNALMKDSPAILAAVVASRNTEVLASIFDRVITDPKMFRNFIKVVRSGVLGKKSFGTRTKKLLQGWLKNLTDDQLFRANVGNDPSLPDCLKMLHPKPATKSRAAMYGYLLNKEYKVDDLSPLARQFESFKKEMSGEIPDVPFQMLTALPLADNHWKQLADNMTWTQVRMNLNTLARHNVLKDRDMTVKLAKRLSNPELVRKAKAFPYQLFTTFQNMDAAVPANLTNALQDAADAALDNIPEFNSVAVLVDTSGSMSSSVTGNRGSVTTKTRCIDVASLFASAILRKNNNAEIVPFDTTVHIGTRLNPRDSIMTNTKALASFGGGGTDCASALRYLNDKKANHQLVIMISDNESWFSGTAYHRGTGMANEWNRYLLRNPNAKLVCLDIQPSATTQVNTQKSVLNLGGFNDTVFEVIKTFTEVGNNKDLWISTIESVQI